TGLILLDFSRETQDKGFSAETFSSFKGSQLIFQIFKHRAGQNRVPNAKIQPQSDQNLQVRPSKIEENDEFKS
ncbi:unnamed protein product, partial [Gulo gulo]